MIIECRSIRESSILNNSQVVAWASRYHSYFFAMVGSGEDLGALGGMQAGILNRYSGYGIPSRELSGQQLNTGIICMNLSP